MSACCVQPYAGTPGSCPSFQTLQNMHPCDAVAVGALCEGDGECGTSQSLNNCQTWDLYTRIACPRLLSSLVSSVATPPSPPSPSPSPAPPPVSCPGNMVYSQCGSSCNSTCSEPNPSCAIVCVERCECPLDTPVWHDHLGTCGTTTQCLTPATSAANTPVFLNSPCAAYQHTNDESLVNASSYFHTGQPKMAMFTSDWQECCDTCNSLNQASPPPPPGGPPPPSSPPGSMTYYFPGVVDLSPKACHAISVHNNQFGFSCRFYDQRSDGSMGALVLQSPALPESLTYQGSTRWYTLPFPPPPSSPPSSPPSPSPPPPFAPPIQDSSVVVHTECPKLAPTGGDNCANYTLTSSCAYGLFCCPDGACNNLTSAVCNEGVWQRTDAPVYCPDSSPAHPPPPSPPPSEDDGIDVAMVAGFTVAGLMALLVLYGCYALNTTRDTGLGDTSTGRNGVGRRTGPDTKPLLTPRGTEVRGIATLPPWTFKSISVNQR